MLKFQDEEEREREREVIQHKDGRETKTEWQIKYKE